MASKKASRPTPGRSPWTSSAVAPQDLETAKREALLQLRLGRSSHLTTVLVSAALAVDAILLLFVFPTLPSLGPGTTGPLALERSFYLLILLASGLAIAAVGVAAKWGDFVVWPWEGHFAASVGALGYNVLVSVLYATRLAGVGPLGHAQLYPTFVPLALAGVSVGLLGVVASWTPWGGRQWTSAVTAVAPIATSLLLYAPPSIVSNATSEALAVALLVSAILYQTSGSFLHLVSSATGPHEAAVVLTGQNRIVRLASELQQRDEAIRFREAALVRREADAEATEGILKRGRDAQLERQKRLDQLEENHRATSEALAERDRELAGRAAGLEAQARAVLERAKEVEVRSQEVARRAPEVASREQRLAQREGELAGRDLALKQRAAELDRRDASVRESEARFNSRRKEIDTKTAELLRREGEVTAREKASGGGRAAGATVVSSSPDLAAREVKVHQLKNLLDEQNVQLGRRAKELADQAHVVETAQRQNTEREAHLVAREAALSQQEEDLRDRLKAADEHRLQFETVSRDYQRRLEEVGQQQVAAARKGADVDRTLQGLADREKSVTTREAALRTASEELDRREGAVVLRERALEADEAEVSLRRQEIGREGALPFAGLLAVAGADRGEGAGAGRPVRARRAKPALGSQETATADAGTLAPQTGRRYPDRLPSGTPRLDDLLLGGLPPRSHTALVGPAFVGKEIALYAFVAEGLKRSQPVVLVTASRTASEISEGLGVVLPQFREYEQMGHAVTWIDAAGGNLPPGPGRFVPKGPDDHAGILSALVQASKRAEETSKGGGFRVGFLGLSAVLAHAEERAGFSFLQNVVGILKPRNALAMYALEAGALTEAQVESLLGRMDGAIVFRQERDRTFLSVKGFGDVATRDWVEVRATSRNLIVGSFALERIR